MNRSLSPFSFLHFGRGHKHQMRHLRAAAALLLLVALGGLAAADEHGSGGAKAVLPFGAEPDPALAKPPPSGWTPALYPNPATDPAACGRPPPSPSRPHGSWVCDPDGVLSGPGADAVEGVLRDVAAARAPYAPAPCGSPSTPRPTPGFQVAVAVMDRLEVASGSSSAEAAASFARALMDAWGVGAAGCNDGTVVLLSRQDRQV